MSSEERNALRDPDPHTATQTSAEAVRLGLQEAGVGPEDLAWLVLTHIHLDHAGAAGWLAQQGAEIYVRE